MKNSLIAFLTILTLCSCGTERVFLKDGTNGADGANGLNGADGAMGPQGPMGPMGIPGLPGVACFVQRLEEAAGVTVTCGETSVTIYDGINGANGADGTNGADGIDGSNGADGANGLDGEDGANGADGTSCSVAEVESGALITCTDGTSVLIPFQLEDDDGDGEDDDGKVTICHKVSKNNFQTLSVAPSAVPAHLGHGDSLGSCEED